MTREALLQASVQSGLLFLAIWAVFTLIPSIPANAKAWIWRLAFLKSLIGLAPFAVVTLRVLPAPESAAAFNEPVVSSPTISAPVVSVPPPVAPDVDLVLLVWGLGVATFALYGGSRRLRAARIALRAQPVMEPATLGVLTELLRAARVDRPVRLLASSEVESALLLGGLRTTIVLPSGSTSPSDIRLMLAHEIAHIARRDLFWFGAQWVAQALFFFNPLVWLAAHRCRLDHESATDWHASQLAKVPVQTYAEMLLRATVVARASLVPGALPMAESYRTIHRRLEAMKHFNSQPSLKRKAVVGALALATLGLMPIYQLSEAASPQETPKPATQPSKDPRRVKKAKPGAAKRGTIVAKARTSAPKATGARSVHHSVAMRQEPAQGQGVSVKGTGAQGAIQPTAGTTRTTPNGSAQASVSDSKGGRVSGGGQFSTGGQADKPDFPNAREFAQANGVGGGQGGAAMSGGQGQASASGSISGGASGQGSGSIVRIVNGKREIIERNSSDQGTSWSEEYYYGTNGQGIQMGPSSADIDVFTKNGQTKLSFRFERYDVRSAFRTLFRAARKDYRIDGSVQGGVTITAKNVDFETALRILLRAANADYRLEDGTYVITSAR